MNDRVHTALESPLDRAERRGDNLVLHRHIALGQIEHRQSRHTPLAMMDSARALPEKSQAQIRCHLV